MQTYRIAQILLLAGLAMPLAVTAADLKAGQSLHDEHCMKCHDSGVYTRNDRRITSLEGLRKQVARCELSLGLTWFDDQRENVVQYLNSTYYKLP